MSSLSERERRWAQLHQHGLTVWLTGLSGAGKSTVASAVETQLLASGRWCYRLDGDLLRTGISHDLSFSPADRTENVRRVGEIALMFADAGAVALVALVSPYAADRQQARALHECAGLEFIEVFVNTSLAECSRRDSKGLYARAQTGDLTDLTGISSPYQPPLSPEVEITESTSVDEAATLILAAIAQTAPE